MTTGDPGAIDNRSGISPGLSRSPRREDAHAPPELGELLITALLSGTLMLFSGMPGVAGVSAQSGTPPAAATTALDDRIRGWIEEAIDPDTGRGAIRLPAVGIDDTGDLTVVFALREKDDLDAFRAAAEEDVFASCAPSTPNRTAPSAPRP